VSSYSKGPPLSGGISAADKLSITNNTCVFPAFCALSASLRELVSELPYRRQVSKNDMSDLIRSDYVAMGEPGKEASLIPQILRGRSDLLGDLIRPHLGVFRRFAEAKMGTPRRWVYCEPLSCRM
jgi:hypothetical protein